MAPTAWCGGSQLTFPLRDGAPRQAKSGSEVRLVHFDGLPGLGDAHTKAGFALCSERFRHFAKMRGGLFQSHVSVS